MPRLCFPLPDVLDPAACARLIADATARGFAATGVDYPASYRNNDRLVHDEPALAAWLFERVRADLPAVLDLDGERWELVGLNERFRFCRYRGGQGFRIHRDGAHAPAPDRRSLLTFQIYLDDASGFGGGRTRFYTARRGTLTHAVVPHTGHAIVFDHQYWHDGEPVPEGTKHVLRTDVIYRRTTAVAGHTGYVYALQPLADGRLASASRDRTIRIGDRILAGHAASVTALAQPAPGLLLSGSRDHAVRRWDLAAGTSTVLTELPGAVLSLTATHAGCGDGKIYPLDGGAPLAGHTGWVWALAQVGDVLVSGAEDGTIRSWPGAAVSPGHGPVHALAVLPGGGLAAGFADGFVGHPGGGFQAHEGEVYALAVLDEHHLATGGEDDLAKVWHLPSGRCVARFEHGDFVRAVAAVGPGQLATGSYDGRVRRFTWA
jgi:WD40 repeat protein